MDESGAKRGATNKASFKRSLRPDEDGHELWLRYSPVTDAFPARAYSHAVTEIVVENHASSPTLTALREELEWGLAGLLGAPVACADKITRPGAVVAGTPSSSQLIKSLKMREKIDEAGAEGYLIVSTRLDGRPATIIASTSETGALYGAFAFLRLIQTGWSLSALNIIERPAIAWRQLDHWETERCYAGGNIWRWEELPAVVDPKYKLYARANASLGINGVVLNNVNAKHEYLSPAYMEKEKALADLFRPYGIRVFLSANFASPIALGGLATADPGEPAVAEWWRKKCAELYARIPDFGGFVVKANSEGEPGPKDYGRGHAEGANLLARALAPFGGIVLWRAFVYDEAVDADRLKRAYLEFTPLDGRFEKNVLVQVKNGPLDFQPREPFHPLFGKMPHTPLALEFQITQEYLGQEKHLVYLAPMWREVLEADTGGGFTVAQVVDGSAQGASLTALAGVANTGGDRNWCGHHFGQANWYAFGRLAWDHSLSAEAIADEWARMTWGNDPKVIAIVKKMMLGSHEACVDYMTPLGLGHIMARDHHYGPQPDDTVPGRPDWSPTYYHQADAAGLGYDRSRRGSGLSGQYFPAVGDRFDEIDTCPENLLCWFHHVPWNRKMKSGRSFWDELCFHYDRGVAFTTALRAQWDSLGGLVDDARFAAVGKKLAEQEASTKNWRETCLSYFQRFSGLPIRPSSMT